MADEKDSEFYTTFKGGMSTLGLPCPETLFGSLATATATIGALANGINKLGTKVTLRELMMTFPAAASGVVAAGAVAEITAAIGALSAAFYIGACVGCLLGAAVDTYGISALASLGKLFSDIKRSLGSIESLIRNAAKGNPRLSTLNTRLPLARMVDGNAARMGRTAYA